MPKKPSRAARKNEQEEKLAKIRHFLKRELWKLPFYGAWKFDHKNFLTHLILARRDGTRILYLNLYLDFKARGIVETFYDDDPDDEYLLSLIAKFPYQEISENEADFFPALACQYAESFGIPPCEKFRCFAKMFSPDFYTTPCLGEEQFCGDAGVPVWICHPQFPEMPSPQQWELIRAAGGRVDSYLPEHNAQNPPLEK